MRSPVRRATLAPGHTMLERGGRPIGSSIARRRAAAGSSNDGRSVNRMSVLTASAGSESSLSVPLHGTRYVFSRGEEIAMGLDLPAPKHRGAISFLGTFRRLYAGRTRGATRVLAGEPW